MAMTVGFRNSCADHGAGLITHIGLVDETGTEITGGSPAYARVVIIWVAASSGVIRPNADLTFNVPASTIIGGWRGYSASTVGTDYQGEDLTNEVFANQGQFVLVASSTGIAFSIPA